MLYLRETAKSIDRACADLDASIRQHGFGVLHAYDFRGTLAEKGFPIDRECRVLEVCNPRQASDALKADMNVNLALPCRISVYEDGGRTLIGMLPPTELLALISKDPAIAQTARDVERALERVIAAAV